MKVLFLTNYPSPYRVKFFNEIGKRADLTVLFERSTVNRKVRNAKWIGDSFMNFKGIFLSGIKVGEAEGFCPGVLKYIKKNAYDKIIVGVYSSPTQMLAILYMKIREIKFWISTDGGVVKNERKLNYFLKRFFISAADGWFSTGKISDEYLTHYGADEGKIYRYPFSSFYENQLYEVDRFLLDSSKDTIRKRLGMVEKRIILSVGRFSYLAGYGKGYDVLLKAAGELSDEIGIYIVGDEPTEEFIRIKDEANLEHVHFVGFKEPDELKYYYAAADMFVLMTVYDVWGLVINEAMMYQLPVVTTDMCLAGTELVGDENGTILPVGDADGLVKVIKNLFLNEKVMISLGAESRKKISGYTIEKMAEAHIEALGF